MVLAIETPYFSATNLWIPLSPALHVVDPFPSKMDLLDLVTDPSAVAFEFTDDGNNFLLRYFIRSGF